MSRTETTDQTIVRLWVNGASPQQIADLTEQTLGNVRRVIADLKRWGRPPDALDRTIRDLEAERVAAPPQPYRPRR